MLSDLEPDGPHWRYALAVYGKEGVARACLRLQDEANVDVNVLLMALHASRRARRAVTDEDIAGADRLISAWREDIVVALREIRGRLKEGPAPAPSPRTEALRTVIKQAELQAEQIEMAVLARHFADRILSPVEPLPATRPEAGAEEIARQVIDTVTAFYAARQQHAEVIAAGELVDAVHAPLVRAIAQTAP